MTTCLLGLATVAISACATNEYPTSYADACRQDNSARRAAGAAVGAGIGALAGAGIAHDDTAGAVIGGIGGAVVGSEVARSTNRDCSDYYYYDRR
jgi:uncharacterized membrane protein